MMNAWVINYRFYIQKLFHYCLILCVALPLNVFSQQELSVTNNLRSEQWRFVSAIRGIRIDTAIVYSVARYVDDQVNDLHRSITKDRKIKRSEKDKALRSAVYFITELGRLLQTQKFDVYSVPAAFDLYRKVLYSLTHDQSLDPYVGLLDSRESQLLAAAFTQYEEYRYLEDVATYRRVAATPEYIFQFLESRKGFRFTDSLLLAAAVHDPMKLVWYLEKKKEMGDRIRNSKNPYIQQIVSLSHEKNASELLPFMEDLRNNRMAVPDILKTRTKTIEYFQLLVNTLQASVHDGNTATRYLKPLRSGIRQKALAFYVHQVNDLHDSPDATRFASVKNLRAIDLYYLITSCGEELYTSSYLGLYKRMKQQLGGTTDSLFDLVGHDNFHVFMRLAANYNVLADFLSGMRDETARMVMHKYISSIGQETGSGVEMAMDIADSFGALAGSPELLLVVENEIQTNLQMARSTNAYLGMRLYSILSQVFQLVKQDGNLERLWVKLGNYDLLPERELRNRKGEVVELVLFYGDEDGVASFRNFQKLYTDSDQWEVTKTAYWMNVRSRGVNPVNIYANLPLDIKEGLDVQAQDSLTRHLSEQGLEPSILVHRGHSYHLEKTLNRLRPSVKLAILGSCGGYNKAISIASINPDVHIIGSKKTGSKSINDPLIDAINETLTRGNDLSWPLIWDQLEQKFSRDALSMSLFNEYFPPSTNVGLFVLKLFRQTVRES